jgi:hypothetical protein
LTPVLPGVDVQLVPKAGNAYDRMPEPGSVEDAVRVTEPEVAAAR